MTPSSRPAWSPWDVAAGSLIVTEAGGLIGNFTGEADYLHQREVVAGNPKITHSSSRPWRPHPGHQGRRSPAAALSVEPAAPRSVLSASRSLRTTQPAESGVQARRAFVGD